MIRAKRARMERAGNASLGGNLETRLERKLMAELANLRKIDPADELSDPTAFWKQVGSTTMPLLSKFWAAYSPFQVLRIYLMAHYYLQCVKK